MLQCARTRFKLMLSRATCAPAALLRSLDRTEEFKQWQA